MRTADLGGWLLGLQQRRWRRLLLLVVALLLVVRHADITSFSVWQVQWELRKSRSAGVCAAKAAASSVREAATATEGVCCVQRHARPACGHLPAADGLL